MEHKELVQQYLSYLAGQRHRSESTLHSYRCDLEQFCEYLHEKITAAGNVLKQDDSSGCSGNSDCGDDYRLQHIDTEKLLEFQDFLRSNRYTENTVFRKMVSLRKFYDYLEKVHIIASHPFATLDLKAPQRKKPEYLTAEQVGKLFDAVVGDSWIQFRDRAIIGLLYNTGIRVGELLELRVKDVDFDHECVIVHSCNNKTRVLTMWPSVSNLLGKYIQMRSNVMAISQGTNDSLFINADGKGLTDRSVRRRLEYYGQTAEINFVVTPAILRHSCAVRMLQEGASEKEVRMQLGHLSKSAIRPYLLCNERQQPEPRQEEQAGVKEELFTVAG